MLNPCVEFINTESIMYKINREPNRTCYIANLPLLITCLFNSVQIKQQIYIYIYMCGISHRYRICTSLTELILSKLKIILHFLVDATEINHLKIVSALILIFYFLPVVQSLSHV